MEFWRAIFIRRACCLGVDLHSQLQAGGASAAMRLQGGDGLFTFFSLSEGVLAPFWLRRVPAAGPEWLLCCGGAYTRLLTEGKKWDHMSEHRQSSAALYPLRAVLGNKILIDITTVKFFLTSPRSPFLS